MMNCSSGVGCLGLNIAVLNRAAIPGSSHPVHISFALHYQSPDGGRALSARHIVLAWVRNGKQKQPQTQTKKSAASARVGRTAHQEIRGGTEHRRNQTFRLGSDPDGSSPAEAVPSGTRARIGRVGRQLVTAVPSPMAERER